MPPPKKIALYRVPSLYILVYSNNNKKSKLTKKYIKFGFLSELFGTFLVNFFSSCVCLWYMFMCAMSCGWHLCHINTLGNESRYEPKTWQRQVISKTKANSVTKDREKKKRKAWKKLVVDFQWKLILCHSWIKEKPKKKNKN